MKMHLSTSAALAITILAVAALTSCPLGPEREKRIQGEVRVPGLQESLQAKDLAVKAAILMSWSSDPELAQEQLAVEDVRAGKVRITGIVSRPELKDRAERVARNQEGVEDVVSTITVDEKLKEKRISLDDM